METSLHTSYQKDGTDLAVICKLILEELHSMRKDSVSVGNSILEETKCIHKMIREEMQELTKCFQSICLSQANACLVTSPSHNISDENMEFHPDAAIRRETVDELPISEGDSKDEDSLLFSDEKYCTQNNTTIVEPTELLSRQHMEIPQTLSRSCNFVSGNNYLKEIITENDYDEHNEILVKNEEKCHRNYNGRPTMVNNTEFVILTTDSNNDDTDTNFSSFVGNADETNKFTNLEDQSVMMKASLVKFQNSTSSPKPKRKTTKLQAAEFKHARPNYFSVPVDRNSRITQKTPKNTNPVLNTFQCKFCVKSFSTGCSLTRHLRIHTGERPYQCEVCHNSFKQKEHLNKHMKIHINLIKQ